MINERLDEKKKVSFRDSIFFRGLEATMLIHMSLQRRYIIDIDPKVRQRIMVELMAIDCRVEGYFIGVGRPQYINEWKKLVDFGLGHTKEDLRKWEGQFKEWQ